MERPQSVTVFGILNIGFGAMGLLGLVMTAVMFSSSFSMFGRNNPVIEASKSSPEYRAYMHVSTPIAGVASVALMIAGLGLLSCKEWARKLSIGYAVYGIIATLLAAVMTYAYVFAPLLARPGHPQSPEEFGARIGAQVGMFSSVFGLAYPIVLLAFMFRPVVKAACAGLWHPPQPPWSGPYQPPGGSQPQWPGQSQWPPQPPAPPPPGQK